MKTKDFMWGSYMLIGEGWKEYCIPYIPEYPPRTEFKLKNGSGTMLLPFLLVTKIMTITPE
jgi:hypothetical protein